MSYHPTDNCMISASVDGTIRVWKTWEPKGTKFYWCWPAILINCLTWKRTFCTVLTGAQPFIVFGRTFQNSWSMWELCFPGFKYSQKVSMIRESLILLHVMFYFVLILSAELMPDVRIDAWRLLVCVCIHKRAFNVPRNTTDEELFPIINNF